MPNGFFLSYKRRRTRKKKVSRAERTKCCRTVFGHFSLCFSPLLHSSFLCRFSGRLALLRGTPVCFRQHLRPAPFLCVEANRHRHLFAALFATHRSLSACIYSVPIAGCSVLIAHPLLTYIYVFFRLLRLPVSASTRVICVEGPCPCVSLVLRSLCPCFLQPRLLFGSRPLRSRLISIRTRVLSRHRNPSLKS